MFYYVIVLIGNEIHKVYIKVRQYVRKKQAFVYSYKKSWSFPCGKNIQIWMLFGEIWLTVNLLRNVVITTFMCT